MFTDKCNPNSDNGAIPITSINKVIRMTRLRASLMSHTWSGRQLLTNMWVVLMEQYNQWQEWNYMVGKWSQEQKHHWSYVFVVRFFDKTYDK